MSRANRFFQNIEWRWSLWNLIQGALAVTSFALPAWAVRTAELFPAYSPASWVAAGFLGFFVIAAGYWLFTSAYSRWISARYNARLYEKSDFIDPMGKIFQDQRIFLDGFILPSHPLVEGKTFINCDIIGPANIVLQYMNHVSSQRYPICDTVLLKDNATYYNAILFRHCTFRECSFQRITVLIESGQFPFVKGTDWINWISKTDEDLGDASQASLPLPQAPSSPEEETQP
jgi:hypothetical protein